MTGGLSLKAYIAQNTKELFEELMEELDGPNLDHDSYHNLFQGFRCQKDQRGYVSEFQMNSILVHAFADED